MERKLAKWEQMSNLSPRFEVRKFLEAYTVGTLLLFWILAPEFLLLSSYEIAFKATGFFGGNR